MTDSRLSILHVSTADNLGGSARAAYRIHSGLRAAGQLSRMLVRTKVTDDGDVAVIDERRPLRRHCARLLRDWIDPAGWQYLFYPTVSSLRNDRRYREADIVQLYNIHGGYFSFRSLPAVSLEKPVVWRLSDMWAFTGHCSYAHECVRWESGCGSCPHLEEYPPLWRDTTAALFRAKLESYRRSRMTIVVTNSWMEGLVHRSPLLSAFPVTRIPNGVDTAVFAPGSRVAARRLLGWPEGAKIVLFMAHIARPGTRKGGALVGPAVAEARRRVPGLQLAVMGEGAEAWPDHPEFPTLRVAYSDDNLRLAQVYAAADLLIHPANVENLPNTVLEGMAVGLPTVAFDVGGVCDIVRHRETGYLARPQDPEDLARGVTLVAGDSQLRARLSAAARRLAESEHSLDLQVERYLALYRGTLDARRATGA
jgi:glycosyltransferase involved in cell wall biosynthesis